MEDFFIFIRNKLNTKLFGFGGFHEAEAFLGAQSQPFHVRNSLNHWQSTLQNCEDLHCPKGFICYENECCQESKNWDPDTEHFTIALIVFWVIFALLCICGLVMSKCQGLQHDLRPADHHTPQNPPSKAPLESIWVTSVDPLPTIRCSEFN
eukprot:XP_017453293.1 PREDICTED: transmembrane protein 92-like [Rattus norvegicus]